VVTCLAYGMTLVTTELTRWQARRWDKVGVAPPPPTPFGAPTLHGSHTGWGTNMRFHLPGKESGSRDLSDVTGTPYLENF